MPMLLMSGLEQHGHLRSEEHTSELQSRLHLVCRLLLEKKKQNDTLTSTQPSATFSVCRPYFFHSELPHRDLHSFPTRRSSDLTAKALRNPAVTFAVISARVLQNTFASRFHPTGDAHVAHVWTRATWASQIGRAHV